MLPQILLYTASAMTALWGLAHLFPTKSVVQGFGEVSLDNRRIITMEWILEGVALIGIGFLVAVVTLIDMTSLVSQAVYVVCAVELLAFAGVSLFTGFKVKFLPFRLCPFVFAASSILILSGGVSR